MILTTIASTVSDNWFYLIESDEDLLLIDPIDAKTAIAEVNARPHKRLRILNTHGHPDHVGGNDEVQAALGCEVIASAHPDIFDPPAQHRVQHGDTISVGQSTWQVLHAPGHTSGHIVLYHEGHLICGDVFFVAGAGNCRFGGDPQTLFETFHEGLKHLPDDTRIYPGHDYALRNLEFCLHVEADNTSAAQRIEAVRAFHGTTPRKAPYLTTLGEERSYNPFHRVHDPKLQATLKQSIAHNWDHNDSNHARAAFIALRKTRDSF